MLLGEYTQQLWKSQLQWISHKAGLSSQSKYFPKVPQRLSHCPIWIPTPSPASECVPPLRNQRGGQWGGGGVPIRMTGEKAWHSVYSVFELIFYIIEAQVTYKIARKLDKRIKLYLSPSLGLQVA